MAEEGYSSLLAAIPFFLFYYYNTSLLNTPLAHGSKRPLLFLGLFYGDGAGSAPARISGPYGADSTGAGQPLVGSCTGSLPRGVTDL